VKNERGEKNLDRQFFTLSFQLRLRPERRTVPESETMCGNRSPRTFGLMDDVLARGLAASAKSTGCIAALSVRNANSSETDIRPVHHSVGSVVAGPMVRQAGCRRVDVTHRHALILTGSRPETQESCRFWEKRAFFPGLWCDFRHDRIPLARRGGAERLDSRSDGALGDDSIRRRIVVPQRVRGDRGLLHFGNIARSG
jgi:hypothetical protein